MLDPFTQRLAAQGVSGQPAFVEIEQELTVVGRLFPQALSGEKTSTIRWREAPIRPGPMRYVCADDSSRTTVVEVRKCTSMPLLEAAAFLGREADWSPEVMLDGMREHYPDIELTDIVDVIEHDPPVRAEDVASG